MQQSRGGGSLWKLETRSKKPDNALLQSRGGVCPPVNKREIILYTVFFAANYPALIKQRKIELLQTGGQTPSLHIQSQR